MGRRRGSLVAVQPPVEPSTARAEVSVGAERLRSGSILTDSPVGQLAWIVEKFGEWTDRGLPDEAVGRDQLLTNVMLYWVTGTAGSSARLYYETAHAGARGPPVPSATPTGIAVFLRDIAPPIRRFAELYNNIVHWNEFNRGGHFAAMEVPDLLVGDVREFFRQLR